METTAEHDPWAFPDSTHTARCGTIRDLRATKITDFFKPDRPSKRRPISGTSFLDLPAHIRDRIYEEAGVGGNEFIDLNIWLARGLNLCWKDDDDQPPSIDDWTEPEWRGPRFSSCSPFNRTPFPAALLWAGSHLIHNEVQAKIYSENTFAVSLAGNQSLRPLEMLSDAALRELRVLFIIICPCKCLTPCCQGPNEDHSCYDFDDRPDRRGFWRLTKMLVDDAPHSRPLGCISWTDKQTLSQWERICARLRANSRPRQLSLYLVANVADPQTAKRIVDPLDGLPILKDLGINLGRRLKGCQNFEPKSFVRQVVQKLTDTVPYKQFPFLDLPLELQIKIIQQSKIAHYRSNRAQWYATSPPHWPRNDWHTCHSKEIDHYYYSEAEDTYLLDESELDDVKPLVRQTAFCFLENPAAFNNRCKCTPTGTLFEVSKAFSVVAEAVYFTENMFSLHYQSTTRDFVATGQDQIYPLALPSFLHFLPHRYISSLRNICILLPPCTPDFLAPGQSAWDEWVWSIELLEQSADLTRLRLEIHFCDQNRDPYLPGAGPEQHQITAEFHRARIYGDAKVEEAMLDAYKRILGPLKRLGPGLRALVIYVSWPLCYLSREKRKADETMLERMIMGQEYDSAKFGKFKSSPYSQPRDYPGPDF
ncbi:unnamed protein product [Clonostachys byssicola]|uniref:Uncharacterized protein n=1 Tax=Clonostachys byssicola TaxID=160290 RepID=A0A9N9U7L9_9HYPO|nr:unnamed protein product [Clonostachys byssicola]